MIAQKIINDVVSDKIAGYPHTPENFSHTRDTFNARLQVYISETENWLASAVIGEIGNNTFDHNC